MSFFKKKKILVTHNNTFHADDVFATAILSIALDGNIKVTRTRDEKLIESADIVYDVGGVYDASKNRFDHHQTGGAGTRNNGIPYAACGLVWMHYGEQVCGSKEIADRIDSKLIQAVDANDNGINLFEVKGEVSPYTIQDLFYVFRPSWKEAEEYDKPFMRMVDIAILTLKREIILARDRMEAEGIIKSAYDKAPDKRVIVLGGNYPWQETILKYKEPLYVVSVKETGWRAEAVRNERNSFSTRKPFPASWAGLREKDLAIITGVPDAVFCHRGLFLAVAKSKEGILALVEKALLA